ncbi:MAG: DUF2784 domain-containing protein [Candidatus Bathyarchaeia archaeon]
MAEITVFIQLLFIIFLIGGFTVIVLGHFLKWPITRHLTFRTFHLIGFLIVVGFELAGLLCPLTYLEIWLRNKQDPESAYFGSFIAHYIEKIIYWEVPMELILLPTCAIAILTLLIFLISPPNRKKTARYQN